MTQSSVFIREKRETGFSSLLPSLRRTFLQSYFDIYHRLEVKGEENIPQGPVLLVANHGGGFDLDVLALINRGHSWRSIEVMIADAWHHSQSLWGKIAVGSGIATPTSGGFDITTLAPFFETREPDCPMVAIFPEGDQGRFEHRYQLRPFFPGVVRIALFYDVPVVPVAMVGFHRASPIFYDLAVDHGPADPIVMMPPLPLKLTIEYGEPIRLEKPAHPLSRHEETEIANTTIRSALARLLRKYHRVACL